MYIEKRLKKNLRMNRAVDLRRGFLGNFAHQMGSAGGEIAQRTPDLLTSIQSII